MKYTTRYYYFLGILSAICLMWILLITSIEAVCYWTPGYFEKEYTKYQVLNDLPQMSMDDLLDVTGEMMDYLRGTREDLHVTTTMGGVEREFFNEREIAHMEDVRGLFLRAISLRRIALGFILATMFLLVIWKAPLRKILPRCICIGSGIFLAVVGVLAAIISTDFTKYFVIFHHIFFDNDLWILNPATDMLINIVPEGFFMDTAARIGALYAILVALILGVSIALIIKGRTHGQE